MNTQDALPSQPLDDWFLDLLVCPACTQHWPVTLNEEHTMFLCACGKYGYPLGEGNIPNLLVESATVLDPEARPEAYSPAETKTPE